MKKRGASRSAVLRGRVAGSILAAVVTLAAGPVSAQQGVANIINTAQQTVRVERGKTALMQFNTDLTQVSVGDTAIANVQAVDVRQLMINGLQIGATTLIIWELGVPRLYNIEVTADATALQTQLVTLFPGADITVSTSGAAVILSGTVRNPTIARRAAELATLTGAQVINNLQSPSSGQQVLLHVRFAEIRRTAGSRLGVDLFGNNVAELDQVFGDGSTASIETLSEGIMRLFLIGREADLEASIRALRSKGEYRSLAEPNLVTMEGQEASFLAGGEFPYPTIQQAGGTGNVGQVTITFKEFGIRLRFTPNVTNSGTVVLHVAPEVSSLDFANGLSFGGFQIPSLLTRRAESTVELRPGQHLAIAGLLDNTFSENVTKIPFLGDLPILGALFRSKQDDQNRTELLVLVTPHLVEASDVAPAMPTGEPNTWRWDRNMKVDTTRGDILPARRRTGGN